MSEWQPIETAPKDGTKVDLWAKTWRAAFDDFVYQRFPDCHWYKGDTMSNSRPEWAHLGKDWHATHWMPLADPPASAGP